MHGLLFRGVGWWGKGGGRLCGGACLTKCLYVVDMLCNEQGCRWKQLAWRD